MYFGFVAFLLFVVQIAVIFHKTALGIYKIEREIQQIHQRLDQKPPVDDKAVQNEDKIS